MALAVKNDVLSRLIAVLNANPGAFTSTVATDQNTFPSDTEIDNAVMEADEYVATRGYFQSVNGSLRESFLVNSSAILNGGTIPFMHGKPGKVEVSQNGTTGWTEAIKAKSKDDVYMGSRLEAYVQAGAFDHLYFIEGENLYIAAPFGRVEYPEYTRTSALQCNKNETTLLIATAVKFLTKHASPAAFSEWTQEAEKGLELLVRDGAYQAGVE